MCPLDRGRGPPYDRAVSIEQRRASDDTYGFYESGAITVVRSQATLADVLAAFGATAQTAAPVELDESIEELDAADYRIGQVFERAGGVVVVEQTSDSAVENLPGLSRGGVAVALWLDEAVTGSRLMIARDGVLVREFEPGMYVPAGSEYDDGSERPPLPEEDGLPWPLLADDDEEDEDDENDENDGVSAAHAASHLNAVWSSLELIDRLTGVNLVDGTDIFWTPRTCFRLRREV